MTLGDWSCLCGVFDGCLFIFVVVCESERGEWKEIAREKTEKVRDSIPVAVYLSVGTYWKKWSYSKVLAWTFVTIFFLISRSYEAVLIYIDCCKIEKGASGDNPHCFFPILITWLLIFSFQIISLLLFLVAMGDVLKEVLQPSHPIIVGYIGSHAETTALTSWSFYIARIVESLSFVSIVCVWCVYVCVCVCVCVVCVCLCVFMCGGRGGG